jgi:hypothetical protein
MAICAKFSPQTARDRGIPQGYGPDIGQTHARRFCNFSPSRAMSMAKAMMAVFADRCSRGHTTTYCLSMRAIWRMILWCSRRVAHVRLAALQRPMLGRITDLRRSTLNSHNNFRRSNSAHIRVHPSALRCRRAASTATDVALERPWPLDRRELGGRLSAKEFAAADPDKDGTQTKDEYLAVVEQRFKAADPDKTGR